MIREAIEKAGKRIDLTSAEMRGSFNEIMSGQAAIADTKEFLAALRAKGETIEEITAAAKVMREKAVCIRVDEAALIDTCGTGGTGINTFNISTTAAFVAAGCGIKVAKHGNRSASCQCGSADVLEALGVKIGVDPERVAESIKKAGIGFMFAPSFHVAMKHAVLARKELGGRTIFNILGPLSNPANASYQVIGVYDEKLTETLAGVLKNLGLKRAFVVHGMDGLDEITIADRTKVTELKSGKLKTYFVSPEDFNIKTARLEDLKGGDARANAEIVMAVLKGEQGPRRDVVLMNASAAIVCAGGAKDFKAGMQMAAESVDSGHALEKLSALIEITNR